MMEAQLESAEDVANELFSVDTVTFKQPEPEEKKEKDPSPEEGGSEENTDEAEKKEENQDEEKKDESPSFLSVLGVDKIPEDKEGFEAVLQKAAKVVTDNRTSFNKEHESVLERDKSLELTRGEVETLRKELETLRSKQEEVEKEKADLNGEEFIAKYSEDYEKDPEATFKQMVKDVREEFSGKVNDPDTIRKIAGQAILDYQQQLCKAAHEDHDEVMEEFIPKLKSDPDLQKEWDKRGKTAESAYQLGKEYQETQLMIKDPEAYRKRIIEEHEKKKQTGDEEEQKKPKEDLALNLSGAASKKGGTAKKKGQQLSSVEDALDSIFS